jgi:hypothetical protein
VSRGAVSASAPASPSGKARLGGIVVEVGRSSGVAADEMARLATTAHDDLAKTLGVSVAPITIRVHESLDSFRAATGRPWWASSVSDGTSIDLVPAALLAQRDGIETLLRIGLADLLVSGALRGRPLWVRVGAARYFGRGTGAVARRAAPRDPCPVDAELTLAISAVAQRDAEARAESCFAREYARTRDWRAVR